MVPDPSPPPPSPPSAPVGSDPSVGSVLSGPYEYTLDADGNQVDPGMTYECDGVGNCCPQACFEAKTKGCREECPKECDELMPGSTLVGTGTDRVCECRPKPCEMNVKNVEPVCLGATPMIDNGDGKCVLDLPAECSAGCSQKALRCPAHCPKDCALLNPEYITSIYNTRFVEGPDGILVQRTDGMCCTPGTSMKCW